jgi:hypothetical protein
MHGFFGVVTHIEKPVECRQIYVSFAIAVLTAPCSRIKVSSTQISPQVDSNREISIKKTIILALPCINLRTLRWRYHDCISFYHDNRFTFTRTVSSLTLLDSLVFLFIHSHFPPPHNRSNLYIASVLFPHQSPTSSIHQLSFIHQVQPNLPHYHLLTYHRP